MSFVSIYQVLPRLFGNRNTAPVFNGSIDENGTGKMSDFTPHVLAQIKDMGFTHIWYTGLIEHARCTANPECGIQAGNPLIIKGKAGSPYAITDYYDIDPDLADSVPDRLCEFDSLVQRTHDAGLKFIIDFVPNHVARQYHSDVRPDADFGRNDHPEWNFSPLNDFYYTGEPLHLPSGCGTDMGTESVVGYFENPAKVTGNDQFSSYPSINDWYETVKLNYGVDYQNNKNGHFSPHPVLWQKMVDILCYWAERKVDAFRCDMAEMVPVEFWQYAIAEVKSKYSEIQFIAEVYNPQMYNDYIFRGGFDLLYDKVGLYDTLRSITCNGTSASQLTQCWQRLEGINHKMLRFLENHDEQRIASRFFAGDPFKALPAMLVTATMNQGGVMVYFGQELGEPADGASGYGGDDGRTTIFDYYSVPQFQKWYNGGVADCSQMNAAECKLREYYRALLRMVGNEPCFSRGEFYDLMWANSCYGGPDTSKIFAFLRYSDGEVALVVVNFDPNNAHEFLLRIPEHAWNCMGIRIDGYVSLSQLLESELPLMLDIRHIIDCGMRVQMQPQSGKVFLITKI